MNPNGEAQKLQDFLERQRMKKFIPPLHHVV
jgi:hypothetical protein